MAPKGNSHPMGNGQPIPWTIANHRKNPLNGPMLVANGPAENEEGAIGGNNAAPKLPNLDLQMDSLISDPICQRLFRLFLVFAGDNLTRHSDGRLLRCVTRPQAQFLIGQIGLLRDQMQIGPDRPLPSLHSEEDAQLLPSLRNDCQIEFAGDQVTFRELLLHLLAFCPRRVQFAPMVDRLFGRYVLQIVRKGFLLCRPVHSLPRLLRPFGSCLLPSQSTPSQRMASLQCRGIYRPSAGHWRPFWCVLTPGQLHLWPLTPKRGTKRKRANLEEIMEMDPSDGGGMLEEGQRGEGARRTLKLTRDSLLEMSDLERGGQLFGWLLATRNGLFEFAHFDQLQRQMWIADLEMVIRKRRPSLLLQFDRLNSNRFSDQNQKGAMRRSPSVGKQILEKENRSLLEMLEAERRALRDEETVRELATRMLDEEVQKGEALRQTVEMLAGELEAERRQRILLQKSLYEKQTNEGEMDENGVGTNNLLMPPERLVTPMPRAKKGKRMRDSLKRRKGGGEELKVVNVKRKEGEEEEMVGNADLREIYERGGTLRAAELWDAPKCGKSILEDGCPMEEVEIGGKLAVKEMILSTQSV